MTEMDDRAAFAESQRENSGALGADEHLRSLARQTIMHADRHHFSYVWNWLGLPIIQLPTDVVAMQEIIWSSRPQVIIETGVARGGSVVLYSSILEMLGDGIVVAIDVDIRPHNRLAIESHPLAHRVVLVEGNSIDPTVVERVRSRVGDAERVMVVLDSDHSHDHVLAELRLYAPLVTPGQYLVVADTVIDELPPQTHRPRPWGPGNSPRTALDAYLRACDRFVVDDFIEGKLVMSQSPGGYLKCVR